MNNTFAEEIRNAVAETLKGKIVEVREVEKANGVIKTGISIRTEGANIAPTIYISEDMSVDENVKMILMAYENTKTPDIDVSFFTDYERVKEKLGIVLTSKPMKGLAKRKAPGFDDLYMNAYVLVDDVLGMGSIKVRTEHLKTWGISNAKLFSDALKSAPVIAPAKRISMWDMMAAMGAPMPIGEGPKTEVLSSESGALGASAILYTDVEEGTYMVPSSVHEVLLLSSDAGNEMELNHIINEVNTTVLDPQDYLSNHAYRYNGKKWENVG